MVCIGHGKRFDRFASGIHVIDLDRKTCIFAKSDKHLSFLTKIKSYKLHPAEAKALRLLLESAWVSHPSGFEFVDINHRFMAATLDPFKSRLSSLWLPFKVKETR